MDIQNIINLLAVIASFSMIPTILFISKLWYNSERGKEINEEQRKDIEKIKEEVKTINLLIKDLPDNKLDVRKLFNKTNVLENKISISTTELTKDVESLQSEVRSVNNKVDTIQVDISDIKKMMITLFKKQ